MGLVRRAMAKRAAERGGELDKEARELLCALQKSDFLVVPGPFTSSPPTMLEPTFWLCGGALYAQVEEGYFCLQRGKLHLLLVDTDMTYAPKACDNLAALGKLLDDGWQVHDSLSGAAPYTFRPDSAALPVADPPKRRGRT